MNIHGGLAGRIVLGKFTREKNQTGRTKSRTASLMYSKPHFFGGFTGSLLPRRSQTIFSQFYHKSGLLSNSPFPDRKTLKWTEDNGK